MTKKQKYIIGIAVCALALVISITLAVILTGAENPQSSESSADEATAATQVTANEETTVPTESPTNATEGPTNPNESPDVSSEPTGADLYCHEFATYSGVYVEDGQNKEVENVAMILVENRSLQFLDQATVTYLYGNQYATFVVTGLPAGEKCWVMEKNKLVPDEGYSFLFDKCTTSFKSDVIITPTQLQVETKDNTITIENTSPNTLENVAVYYKNTLSDGNYLGGISYVMNFGTMNPGDVICKESGHFSDASKIVRYSYQV